jgi:hypothetical protein
MGKKMAKKSRGGRMEAAKRRAAKYGKGNKNKHPRNVKNRPAGKKIMKS